jgi:hypothetical protein
MRLLYRLINEPLAGPNPAVELYRIVTYISCTATWDMAR